MTAADWHVRRRGDRRPLGACAADHDRGMRARAALAAKDETA